MIEFKNVGVKYDDQTILSDLSLTIEEGKSYVLIGSSGCGKTTLLYTGVGLIEVSDGSVRVDDKPIEDAKDSISLMLQNYGLLPWSKVYDNVVLPLKLKKIDREERDKALSTISHQLGIEDLLGRYPHQLSGGQKQRVALARAWITNPKYLFLDEPTSSLDALTQEKIQDMIRNHQLENNLTTLIVTHNIEEAVYLGKTILIMKQGRIVDSFENSTYGIEGIRYTPKFVSLCKKVRGLLND